MTEETIDGILVIDKKAGVTSRDVVDEVSRVLHTKKVGHTGTLDPLATGVLVLCVGKATKLVEILTSSEKSYIAQIQLGISTDTLDTTGKILELKPVSVTEEEIDSVLKQFTSSYLQEVPIYSAVKQNGKKLYEYARENKQVTLPKREVTIFELYRTSSLEKKDNFYYFSIYARVSKGTYIRSLIRDIAQKLNTVGVMCNLRRVKQGSFCLEDAVFVTDNLKEKMISIDTVLKQYPTKIVDDNLLKKIQNGSLLPKEDSDIIYFCDKNRKPLALYRTYEKNPKFIKPWKMFKEEL